MNAVIYARYSSDNQREESIEGQLRECKEYADQNGITVVRTYIDRALSAKTDSRPQFQQMIHDSATHTFEAVLVWKLDRFSRNRYDSAHYKRILKNNRVHVVSVTEPISNTPEGIMLESLLEGMAEYYSAELAEKVSRGHKENALKAKFNGGPVPLGYRIDSEHHYQIDPATAPVVQEAFQRYAAGESIRSIIESLNDRGIRNSRGNPFTKNSFQTLLKNRRYLGEYRYKDTVIPDAIPAIIDPDCFDAVQRRCEIHRQAPAHNKADVHYLLTTKLFCGKCGTMMAGESGRSHTGTIHHYYKCGTRKRSGKEACSLKPVRKEPLEQFVVKTALEKVLNDRVIDLLADKLLEYQSKENTRLPVLQAELKEVKRRIDNLVAAIEQGILTPSTKARMEELEQQREALETGILQEQIEKPPITREQILFWFDQFRHGDPADIAFQEKVIDCFVNSIYLFDDRIVVNFNYQEGGRPVSLEEVLGSFLDGNGAPEKAPCRYVRQGAFLLFPRMQASASACRGRCSSSTRELNDCRRAGRAAPRPCNALFVSPLTNLRWYDILIFYGILSYFVQSRNRKRREDRRDFRQSDQPILSQARAGAAAGHSVAADGGLHSAAHPGAVPAGHQRRKSGAGGRGRPDAALYQGGAVSAHLPANDLDRRAHGHRAVPVARLFLRVSGQRGRRFAGANV